MVGKTNENTTRMQKLKATTTTRRVGWQLRLQLPQLDFQELKSIYATELNRVRGLTVVEMRAEAKSCGLCGFSKMKKVEMLNLLMKTEDTNSQW
jgi:hypothetical protein